MKKNVGSQLIGVQMTTAADGTDFTSAITCEVTIDGGTKTASGGTGPTHEGEGFFTYIPTQAETNGDHIGFSFAASGAISATVQVYTNFPQTVDNKTGITAGTIATVTNGVSLANGAVTDASLAGNMEIVFETDFATNYNTTDNAWVTNGTSFIGTGWNVAKTGYALTTADWNVGKTGYSLTATTGLGAQTANITGNLSGSVGSVTGAVGSVTGAVGSVTGAVGSVAGNVDGSVASNVELGPAEVNAEVVDVLFTDTDAEPAQGLPAATTTLADKIGFLYKAWRNKSTQTATTYSLFNDDAATVDHKATVSDDATTATKGEVATGP